MPLINEEDDEAAHQRSLLINYNNDQRSDRNGIWDYSNSDPSDPEDDQYRYVSGSIK